MNLETIKNLLFNLIDKWENEVVEFKEATKYYNSRDIAKYFSALSNEANLKQKKNAWLIFGVNDKTRKITGTKFRRNCESLQKLKEQIKQITGSISFIDIHEVQVDGKRVLLFEIPAAPCGIPVLANGYAYARAGESLKALDFAQLDAIRSQTSSEDWTAQVIENARFDDLDETALKKAREDFIQKQRNKIPEQEIENWSNETFLGKLRLTRSGKLTRAAVLLFGKNESWGYLSPHPAQITWRLEGPEEAYEHFGLPLYLATSEVYSRIRNIQLRILPDDCLVAVELSKYDRTVIMEALHNCVIHQDYSLNSRIVVTEYPDRVEFLNAGKFFEDDPSDYIEGIQTPQKYRNQYLANAMVQLNMIDSLGSGISRIYRTQAKRYFPLPEYELMQQKVKLIIYGKILNESYSLLLIKNTNLPIEDIIALDRIQKGVQITDEKIIKRLRQKRLVEGRKGRLHILASEKHLSQKKSTERSHTVYYENKILEFLKSQSATRKDVEDLLLDQFASSLSAQQKKRKIGNLLYVLGRRRKIHCTRRGRESFWHLTEEDAAGAFD